MNRAQQGFTLIEVMVAILLMAVVSLIAWRGLDSVTRADQHLQASTEQTEALLRALNQLERDISLRASVELSVPTDETKTPDGLAALLLPSVRGVYPEATRAEQTLAWIEALLELELVSRRGRQAGHGWGERFGELGGERIAAWRRAG